MQKEIWKDIKGYEGLYQVSNLGRVKSFRNKKPKIMALNDNSNGYLIVHFSVKGKRKPKYVHRLVGYAFVPNPENKSEINHKDGIKYNNNYLNIEWCTRGENLSHAYQNNLKPKPCNMKGKKGVLNHFSKPIIQLSLDNEFISRYDCMRQASEMTGIVRSTIGKVCNNHPHSHTAGGYKWRFE